MSGSGLWVLGVRPPGGLGARPPWRWSQPSMAAGRTEAEPHQNGARMGPRTGLAYGPGGLERA